MELTGKLAVALAERGHWAAVGKLVAGANLTTLAAAPGLVAAAVEGAQYTLLSRLLLQVCATGLSSASRVYLGRHHLSFHPHYSVSLCP